MRLAIKHKSFPWVAAASGAVVLGIALWWSQSISSRPPVAFAEAAKRNLVENVVLAGTVNPQSSIGISFEVPGRIADIFEHEGDSVAAGEAVAALDTSDLKAELDGAESDLRLEKAKLAELEAGTRPEEIGVDEAKVDDASSTLQGARAVLEASIADAYAKADDAVNGEASQLFSNPSDPSSPLAIPGTQSQLLLDIQSSRERVMADLSALRGETARAYAYDSVLADIYGELDGALRASTSFLDLAAEAVNGLPPGYPNAVVYRAAVQTARSEIGGAVSETSGAKKSFDDAVAALGVARKNLALDEAGATPEALAVQRAAVSAAEAGVLKIQAELSKAVFRAPWSGVVSRLSARIGMAVQPGQNVGTLLTGAHLEVDAYASESDVAKVKAGDVAAVTLDAYGPGASFPAFVASVSPASESSSGGAPIYKIVLGFSNDDPRLKPGMTANAVVTVAEAGGALSVPSSSVFSGAGGEFVMVDGQRGLERRPVRTGVESGDGFVEILSGLSEGEKVVAP